MTENIHMLDETFFEPSATTWDGSMVVMNLSSGRTAFKNTLDRMDIELSRQAFEKAFARARRVVDQTGEVSTSQLRSIVDEVISGTEILQGVAESFR